MDIFNEFMAAHGSTILYTVVTSIAGYLGIVLKNLYEKTATTKMKKDVINTCVQAVEQIYKDLHGKEKLEKSVEYATAILAEKGVAITELEVYLLIEAAVAEFNGVFKSSEDRPGTEDVKSKE